jgi:hypothetical protein
MHALSLSAVASVHIVFIRIMPACNIIKKKGTVISHSQNGVASLLRQPF